MSPMEASIWWMGALFACVCLGCRSSAIGPGYVAREMEREVEGQRLRYLIHVPDGAAPANGWPMLLFLHGAGERGSDLSLVHVHGPTRRIRDVPALSSCVLVAPQCPAEAWWHPATLTALVEEVRAEHRVDDSRLYLTGLSMGGYGTWNLLAYSPELFAAAVPICGGGDIGRLWESFETGFELVDLLRARDVPIRAFHGEKDPVIPVAESRLLVEALHAVGASVELTVYPGVGHDSWTRTYEQTELYEWIFAQRSATPSGE